jgi:pyruvate formate lyase activating enzyme
MICPWCQNYEISQSPKPCKSIEGEFISPEDHVKAAIKNHCPSISYTYSEPTIFLEYALDTMKLAKEAGLKNIWVSNGFMSLKTLELITPYLDAANIDYKGREEIYHQMTLGSEEIIKRNLKFLYEHQAHIEITTLVIPEVNDNPADLKEIAQFISNELNETVPWHLSRFFPTWKLMNKRITPVSTLKMAKKIGEQAGLKNIYLGNVW